MKMKHFIQPLLIAYAEDHTIVRKGIISLLHAEADIQVTIEAADGNQLIQQLKVATSLPEICLIDIHMPNMDGFECIAAIRKQWPDMKILVLTALTEDIYILKMIKAGVNGFLLKGCDVAEVKTALLAIRNTGQYYSGTFNRHSINAMEDKLLTIPVLTKREQEVLRLSVSDLAYPEMAAEMATSVRSIQGLRDSLFRKLKVHNRASLVAKAIRMGYLNL
jgi:two-component system, NarL family, invasion response regulator UvrY